MAVNNEVLALILGGGQGIAPVSADAAPLEAGRADRRQVPADRHPDQQLPARRHPPHLRADAVQFGVAQPAYLADLPHGSLQPGVRRDPRRRADARQPELVPGHGRRRAAGGPPLRALRRRLLPDSRRRSSLPDGLRASWSTRTSIAGPTSPSPRSRSRIDDASAMGIFRFDRDGQIVAFEEKPNAARLDGDRPEHPARRDVRGAHRGQAVRRVDGHLRLLARRAAGHAGERRRQGLRPRDHPGGARHATACNVVPVSRLLGRRRHRRSRSTTRTSC